MSQKVVNLSLKLSKNVDCWFSAGAAIISVYLYHRRRFLLENIFDFLVLAGLSLVVHVLYSRRRWLFAKISICFGLLWIFIIFPVIDSLHFIGVDSAAEAKNFDLDEALFFLEKLWGSTYSQLTLHKVKDYFRFIAIGSFIFFVLRWIRIKGGFDPKKWAFANLALGSAVSISAIAVALYGPLYVFLDYSHNFETIRKNFSNNIYSVRSADRNKLTVVAYIGESTSAMNMGIYHYYRETTPQLQKFIDSDNGVLLFNNVFSTHTHTTQSLLEALSIGVDERDNLLPINERKRISIVDLFTAAGLKTYLVSNQRQSGLYNEAAFIIFRNAESVFSTRNRYWGDKDVEPEPSDHVFFGRHIHSKLDDLKLSEGGVLFLHSHAGHGPYLLSIIPEEFWKPVDGSLSRMKPAAVTGLNMSAIGDIDAYDSAVRYIDYSIAQTLHAIKARTEPVVFFYFSDHGDSVYTNRLHDSSRFVHEMARIPFLIYFNQPARKKFPELFKKYRSLSKNNSISTLAQLPSTLFDILNLKVDSFVGSQRSVIGSMNDSAGPILIRRTVEGITYLNLNKPTDTPDLQSPALDRTDYATSIFALAKRNQFKTVKLCYHRSNTVGKALRGSLVSDCLEFDVVVQSDGSLSVYHPPADPVGLELSQILDIANRQQRSLWIDAKNINQQKNCDVLADYLSRGMLKGDIVLVEFPSDTKAEDKKLLSCSLRLQSMGIRTSFYVPTGLAVNCSSSLRSGVPMEDADSCVPLRHLVEAAYRSRLFTDFSFDYSGVLAMEHLDFAGRLRWNTWNVPPKAFDSIGPKRFGLIILINNDPNNR